MAGLHICFKFKINGFLGKRLVSFVWKRIKEMEVADLGEQSSFTTRLEVEGGDTPALKTYQGHTDEQATWQFPFM